MKDIMKMLDNEIEYMEFVDIIPNLIICGEEDYDDFVNYINETIQFHLPTKKVDPMMPIILKGPYRLAVVKFPGHDGISVCGYRKLTTHQTNNSTTR